MKRNSDLVTVGTMRAKIFYYGFIPGMFAGGSIVMLAMYLLS